MCENHRLLDFLCLLLSGANMRENIFEYLKLICKKVSQFFRWFVESRHVGRFHWSNRDENIYFFN